MAHVVSVLIMAHVVSCANGACCECANGACCECANNGACCELC